jgi:hypothetical protein
MNDDVLLEQFEATTFPFDEWHHRTHVKVAYLYAQRYGLAVASQKLRDGIRAYNAAHGIPDTPTRGYHETMTQAWLRIIHTTIEEYGPRATADEFVDLHPQLREKKILRLFYSADAFLSSRAKTEFVEPDLANLPTKCRAEQMASPMKNDLFGQSDIQNRSAPA